MERSLAAMMTPLQPSLSCASLIQERMLILLRAFWTSSNHLTLGHPLLHSSPSFPSIICLGTFCSSVRPTCLSHRTRGFNNAHYIRVGIQIANFFICPDAPHSIFPGLLNKFYVPTSLAGFHH